MMAIVEKYSGSWIWRRFSDNFGEEIHAYMRESSELRCRIDDFQKAVEHCLDDLLFINEKEYQFLIDMAHTCRRFSHLPEEIGKWMECIQATYDVEEMLWVVNEISAYTKGLRDVIGVITGLETAIPMMLNKNTGQIVQKPCENLLKDFKILHDHFASKVVPELEEYKRAIDKAERELLEAELKLKSTSEADT